MSLVRESVTLVEALIGEVIGGHEIVRPLGAGGMGEVYLARDPNGTLRAFKIVRAETSPQAAARFRREVLALGRLQHPSIVQIIDAGRMPSGALYLGMEYVAGPDLARAVGWNGPYPVGDAMRILAQLANALAYAHDTGIVHRDLKPANVILEGGDPEKAKIIDFGLAKIVADEGLTRLTDDQQVLGSPLYWAPEQSTHANVGPAADIYALGGIAYFILSGAPMFKPRPAVAMVYAHVHEQPEPLGQRCRGLELPAGLEDWIMACVAKAPDGRPTAAQLAAALDELAAHTPATQAGRRAERLFTTSGTSDYAQALTAQIRQVVLDLAATLDLTTVAVDLIQSDLSDLELELAMLDADPDTALDPTRRDAVAANVTQLQGALAEAFRDLYDIVCAQRPRAGADAQSLFEELDGLVDQYRAL